MRRCALRSVDEHRLVHGERAAIGILRARRHRRAVHFHHAIGRAVHVHIQPEREEVLMMHGRDVLRHHVAVGLVHPIRHRLHRHDAGEGHAHFERAVLVKHPVEAVLVVAGFAEEREDQFARAARIVGVLPGNAGVALVKRHGVRNGARLAGLVGDHGIEDRAVLRAIQSGPQGTGQHSQAEFAGIEAVAEKPGRAGIAVRHHHLRERSAVHHGPHLAAVLVAHASRAPGLRAGAARSGNATSANAPRRPRSGIRARKVA